MPVGGPSFSSVRKARELLREKAAEVYEKYMHLAEHAVNKGDFETAEKIYRYLLEHTADEDGSALLAQSVDKPKQEAIKQGPTVNIGFQLGGITSQPTLPEPTIEAITVNVEPRDTDH